MFLSLYFIFLNFVSLSLVFIFFAPLFELTNLVERYLEYIDIEYLHGKA